MSVTNRYECRHGPKSDCHACLIPEMAKALERIIEARDAYHGGDLARAVDSARAVLDKANALDPDCIPAEQAAEVALDHGHE